MQTNSPSPRLHAYVVEHRNGLSTAAEEHADAVDFQFRLQGRGSQCHGSFQHLVAPASPAYRFKAFEPSDSRIQK